MLPINLCHSTCPVHNNLRVMSLLREYLLRKFHSLLAALHPVPALLLFPGLVHQMCLHVQSVWLFAVVVTKSCLTVEAINFETILNGDVPDGIKHLSLGPWFECLS